MSWSNDVYNGQYKFFETLVGFEYEFYGVDNNTFCIGIEGKKIAFEAIEDENDGYRSYLDTIEISMKGNIFFHSRLAIVVLEVAPERSEPYESKFSGWQLRDVDDHHIWLRVGTDNTDDYYPYFTFDYRPKRHEASLITSCYLR